MTQAASHQPIQVFLAEIDPFSRLSSASLERLLQGAQLLRYRVGQPLLDRQTLPAQVLVLFQGQVRVLGFDERSQRPVSLKLATPGEILGWAGLLRGVACETAIASTETTCISIPAADFLTVMAEEATFRQAWESRCNLCELFSLLSQELQRQADRRGNLKDITLRMLDEVQVMGIPEGIVDEATLERLIDPQLVWLLSGGQAETVSGKLIAGDRLQWAGSGSVSITGGHAARVVGFTQDWLRQRTPQTEAAIAPPPPPVDIVTGNAAPVTEPAPVAAAPVPVPEIPFAPEKPPELPREALLTQPATYPHVRGRGPVNGTLACFQMLNEFVPGLQFRKDRIRRLLEDQLRATGQISMQVCGAIAQTIGFRPQLIQISGVLINRLKAPALTPWKDSFAVIYDISETRIILATPEEGVMRKTPQQFLESWGESGMVLLLEAPVEELPEKFGLSWFVPWILPYKRALIEVVVASFFVQTFGLVQPIITQVIIDKVLGQGSIETMDALGFFMLGVAVFEGILNILRTYLFVDAMNRIDMNVGSAIISHLMRLPLGYFDVRRVGELAGRVNERDSIRNFLTGTALTVFLNAIFSVIYIVVMVVYSWLLTLVALAVVPILGGIIVFAAPIIRQLIRRQAERRADVDSYMVEVISGAQTVKAQNIETKVLWQWQERYARMIQANFKTIMTGTTIGGATSFLNSLSTLALLWAGAYLVIGNQITLGQLIAFKILAGNVTGSLLSLVGAWQQVQEISISVERLADIVDSQPESSDADRDNIPMPELVGSVKFSDLSFRFAETGPLQLANVNLDFAPGTFVGIVGESGSGKSTLMKLLQRLYDPTAGYIQIDGYDISKVELYSLRRQIGMVLQDTLLFTGTVQENIMLANPDATTEEVIHAAKVAAAHDFIMQLPNGYNTVVGERGTGLSGGQRQRIAIARTVLQQPKLLILDEATSALDYNSERQVCNNLAVEFRNRTVFFITHRLNTVLNADSIILMDKGAVVEQGTHEELMAMKGRYYCLFQQQEGSFS
ncbi:MAG: ABC transporter transmembrane domain-containing protein [Limnothrix sp. BL-A-16]|jgi:ATP-binding cassette subfamily B protein